MAGIDTYTKLCLHMDGDQSDSNHTVTVNGNPKLNTTTKKLGASSMYFDGVGDYLTIPDSTDFTFGNDAFTVDFWMYHEVSDVVQTVISHWGTYPDISFAIVTNYLGSNPNTFYIYWKAVSYTHLTLPTTPYV